MGLKFRQVSDLHLEFAPLELPGDADYLLLGGDIITADHLRLERTDKDARRVRGRMDAFVDTTIPKYKKAFHIMGNHEHYHGHFDMTASILREYYARKKVNVQVLDKEAIDVTPDIMLWGGTLWTVMGNGNPMIMNAARLGMNDYNLIRVGNGHRKFQPEMGLEDHQRAMAALKHDLEEQPSKHWIVMTHMAPTWKSVAHKYQGDLLNHCYVSDLDQFILDHPQINIWTHGHTHHCMMYPVGKTTVLCNPRGYVNFKGEMENPAFDPGLTFEIKNEEKNEASDQEANASWSIPNCS